LGNVKEIIRNRERGKRGIGEQGKMEKEQREKGNG
jgi:hypothetical protein